MTKHDCECLKCRNDLAFAAGLALLVLAALVIVGVLSAEQPAWLTYWLHQPAAIRFVAASVAGFVVSVVIGHFVTSRFYKCAGINILAKGDADWEAARALHDWQDKKKVDPALTGMLERLVFTFIVMAHPVGAAAAMGVWLGLKMAVHWNKDIFPKEDKPEYMHAKMFWNRLATLGLLTGFVSMTCAGVGGVVGRIIMGLEVVP